MPQCLPPSSRQRLTPSLPSLFRIARSFDDFPDVAHKKRVEVLLAENRIARVGDDVGDTTRYAHVSQVQLSDNRLRLVKAVVCQLTVLFSRLETIRLEMPACDDD